ncbi:MAG: hypothetical protein ACOY3P_22480 [Planctomycetota bacterium]
MNDLPGFLPFSDHRAWRRRTNAARAVSCGFAYIVAWILVPTALVWGQDAQVGAAAPTSSEPPKSAAGAPAQPSAAVSVPEQPRSHLRAEHHPWGRFEVGAWKLVRTLTETFDEKGRVASTSATETHSFLTSKSPENVMLEVQTTLEVAGKRFESDPQTLTQPFHGEGGAGEVKVKNLPDGEVTIDARAIPCKVQQFEWIAPGNGAKTTTVVHFSPTVEPYVLKRETTTTEGTGKEVAGEQTVAVASVGLPWKVLGEIKSAAIVHSVSTHSKGTTVTWAVYCVDVPGGVVRHTSKEVDKAGNVLRRSTLELLDYGLECEEERVGPLGRLRRRPRFRDSILPTTPR